MLTKLAIRNVKRSIKDYILYVITITLIISLMYAFNCMMFSDLIRGMNAHMDEYRSLLVLFSVVVLIVTAWLINYMTKFMLKKRSKEFGTYLILGMENKSVSKMFFYENILLGVISLVIGMIAGEFVFQGLLMMVGAFFGEEFKVDTHISPAAIFLTIFYYAATQIIVVIRNNKYLKKVKIYDLMNAEKINENVKVKHVARNIIIFFLALLAGVLSVVRVPIIVTIMAIIFFIYGFYMGISGILVLLISRTKRFKYKGMNLFVFRQLASKINTMGFTMGTIAVLFTLALLSGNYAIGLGNFKAEIDSYTPFDICLTAVDPDYDFNDVRKMLLDEGWTDLENEISYKIYRSKADDFTKVLKDGGVSGGYFKYDCYMKVSDYNTLRNYLGLDEVDLKDDEFIIHAAASVADKYEEFINTDAQYALNNKTYKCKEIRNEDFAQNGQNGAGFIVVVPDKTAESLQVYYSQYVCASKKETNDDLYNKILELMPQDAEHWTTSSHWDKDEIDHGMGLDSAYVIYDNIMIKNGGKTAEVQAAIVTVVVSVFYIALVFICVALTILAVQQLSDSAQYKFRYKVLNSLGVDRRKRSKLIFKQLLIYFGCPLIIPVLISLVLSLKINRLLMTGTQIGGTNLTFFIGSMMIFLVVYGIYFTATYFGFKRNIEID